MDDIALGILQGIAAAILYDAAKAAISRIKKRFRR